VGSAVWVVWEALVEASEAAVVAVWVARARLAEVLRRGGIRLVRRMSMVRMRGRRQTTCLRLSSEVEGSGVG
jgi:hypothetical protein